MPASPEAITRAEARIAVNQALRRYRGVWATKLRAEIRKVFPFGPAASDEEKRIWNEVVDEVIAPFEQIGGST